MHDPAMVAADARRFAQAVQRAQPYPPLYVKLKLVWPCNLRCAICRHWRESDRPAVPTSLLIDLIDDLADMGCRKLHLSGGEPTLHPDLDELIARATRAGIRVTMTTNGTLIDSRRADALVAAGLARANVSLDSPNADVHDAMRGYPGSFAKTTRAIRHLAARLPPGKVRLNVVLTADNYLSLGGLADLAHDLGVGDINLIPVDGEHSDLRHLNREEIERYNAQIGTGLARVGQRLGLIRHRRQAFPFGENAEAIEASASGAYARGFYDEHRCHVPWTHCLIDHAGRVRLCCMAARDQVLGDLNRQRFTDIWTGAVYQTLRSSPMPLIEACHRCDMFLEQNRRLERLVSGGPLYRRLAELLFRRHR